MTRGKIMIATLKKMGGVTGAAQIVSAEDA
jgi:hypothetical protein